MLRGRVAAVLRRQHRHRHDLPRPLPEHHGPGEDRRSTCSNWPIRRFARLIQPGDFIVAGKNFGCGSSREQATAALKFAGAGAVIAVSFARIFFRNSINLGLPAVVSRRGCGCAAEGDELEIDLAGGADPQSDAGRRADRRAALIPRAAELLAAGGLIPYLKRKYAA